jgi:hypothetical protein
MGKRWAEETCESWHNFWWEKPERKNKLTTSSIIWEDNIKIDLKIVYVWVRIGLIPLSLVTDCSEYRSGLSVSLNWGGISCQTETLSVSQKKKKLLNGAVGAAWAAWIIQYSPERVIYNSWMMNREEWARNRSWPAFSFWPSIWTVSKSYFSVQKRCSFPTLYFCIS